MRPDWSFSFRIDEFPCFIAWPLVFLLSAIKISPNQVSFVSFLCGLWFLVVLFLNYPALYPIPVFLILLARVILDCADGQLARYTNQKSNLGALYDLMSDFVFTIGLFACLGYVLIVHHQAPSDLVIPIVIIAAFCFLTSSTVFSYISALEQSSDLYPAEVRRRFIAKRDNDRPSSSFYAFKLAVFNLLFYCSWKIVSHISFLLVVNPEKSEHHASALGILSPLEFGMHLTVLAFMIAFQVNLVYFLMFEIIAFCALFLILLYHYRS
jgi:phosphatidylglycerophosphate synthase